MFKTDKKMKPTKKPLVKRVQKPQIVSDNKPRSNRVHITLVSEKERDVYRVPSYGYILP